MIYILLEKQKYFVCGLKISAFTGTTLGDAGVRGNGKRKEPVG